MTENNGRPSRYKSVLVECATGLYGAIGGLCLAVLGTLLSPWLMASPLLGRWLPHELFMWVLNFGLVWIVAAILVALWLDSTLISRTRWARVTAALVFGAFLIYAAFHTRWWSSEPEAWWSTPKGQLTGTAILTMLVLALLPNLRRSRRRVKSRARDLARILLYVLPLLAMVPLWGLRITMQAKMRPLAQRISQVHLPVPPEAQEVVESASPIGKIVSFTLRERYPSTTVTKFYEQHFSAEGWRQDYQGDWEDMGGYASRGRRAKMSHWQGWVSPDGVLTCYFAIEYQTPWGTDPRLPLSQWKDEWLEVQHVHVSVISRNSPWGPSKDSQTGGQDAGYD